MHFIRSEFRGLLPGRFSPESLYKVEENYNDQNKEELDKYVSILHFSETLHSYFCNLRHLVELLLMLL